MFPSESLDMNMISYLYRTDGQSIGKSGPRITSAISARQQVRSERGGGEIMEQPHAQRRETPEGVQRLHRHRGERLLRQHFDQPARREIVGDRGAEQLRDPGA